MTKLDRLLAVALVGAVAACSDTTTPDAGGANVRLRFAAPTAGQSGSGASLAPAAGGLEITGSNGTLTITDVRLVVNELELKLAEGSCVASQTPVMHEGDGDGQHGEGTNEGEDDDHGECDEVELPPHFVQVGVEGDAAGTVIEQVPAGTYTGVEFEVKGLHEGDDDGEHTDDLATLLNQIREQFPDWPDGASILVVGTFTPTDGAPVDFRAFFRGEIEVKLEFDEPLVIAEDAAEKTLTVTVDPAKWFVRDDGTVIDLSQFDFDATGEVTELEFEVGRGFTKCEWEGHGDDD